jgi:hypothetical protein
MAIAQSFVQPGCTELLVYEVLCGQAGHFLWGRDLGPLSRTWGVGHLSAAAELARQMRGTAAASNYRLNWKTVLSSSSR